MNWHTLNANQRRLYNEAVAGTHHRRIDLTLIRRRDSKVLRSFEDDAFLGGSIQGNADQTPRELLEVDLLDAEHVLDWSFGEHRHYRVRVTDSRFVPALDEWVDAVVFTGPLWDFSRDGAVVSLVAHGAERDAMGSVRRVFTRPRKARASAVIRDLLSAAGARNKDMTVPSLTARLPKSVTIGIDTGKKESEKKKEDRKPLPRFLRARPAEDNYWTTALEIAEALGRDLFADWAGRFRLAAPQRKAPISLSRDVLLAPVKERRGEDGEKVNTWIVKGHKRVRATVTLNTRHPLSARSMRWNGTAREVTELIENDHLRTNKQARALGQRRRKAALNELMEYEVEVLPVVPWIRPDALVSIPTSTGRATMRVRSWTLPLGPGADALRLGANRRRGF